MVCLPSSSTLTCSCRLESPGKEHRSRPTWSQAPVVPSPTAVDVSRFAGSVRGEHAEHLARTHSASALSFDATNGTSLLNPFLTTDAHSSPKPKYKTGGYGAGYQRAGDGATSPVDTGLLKSPLAGTGTLRSPLSRSGLSQTRATTSPGSERSPFGLGTSRTVTPTSKPDLFAPSRR